MIPLRRWLGTTRIPTGGYVRRELTPDELAYLLRSVEIIHTPMHNLPGPDRAMVYRLALGTGFRAGELRSLTPASFDLDADPPTVTVVRPTPSGDAKTCSLSGPTWPNCYGPGWRDARREHRLSADCPRTARMLRRTWRRPGGGGSTEARTDAERQQRERSDFLQYQNADGRLADFHATRHTYISGIVAGGAASRRPRSWPGIRTPTLTIGRYSHARLHDLTAALEPCPT